MSSLPLDRNHQLPSRIHLVLLEPPSLSVVAMMTTEQLPYSKPVCLANHVYKNLFQRFCLDLHIIHSYVTW